MGRQGHVLSLGRVSGPCMGGKGPQSPVTTPVASTSQLAATPLLTLACIQLEAEFPRSLTVEQEEALICGQREARPPGCTAPL